ncbi:hypothetical protein KF707_06870 [Candidatus Obscuribacterales bacterium]|nr:hypothetical protein [Candidatus Obscuribacterales bacterium]MBX3135941.1 hypothetical protein [Candidatus Obscuribacterales bacterium]MBX3152608.1 hypothetical protein [Candidatus Obscuribacterales bacterium]
MVQTLSKTPQSKQINSKEDLYKRQVNKAIEKNGPNSLDTGIALLELAELYDKHNQERDSEPIWREIEQILANYVKSGIVK